MGLRFDFNNMYSFSVGSHGVSQEDIDEILPEAKLCALHLKKIIADPKARVNIGLEWVTLFQQNKEEIARIQKFGQEISKKYENVVFLGIGGSYLGLKAAQDALCAPYYNEFKPLRKK
ncbi:MAG: hypothetical protein WC658_05630, partial [Candidatus Omnitrophota bacterium]